MSNPAPAAPGFRRALSNRVFRLELVGYALASASIGVGIVVVSVALFRRGGTTSWATLGVVARVAPFVMLSAITGTLAGRRDQRKVLQLAFAAQLVIAGLLAVSVASAPLAAIVLLGFAGNALWTVAYPTMASLLPRAVADDDLVAANGLLSTVESLAWIAGPGLGGLLVTAFGMRSTIAAQALLALAALAFATAARRAPGAEPATSRDRAEGRESVLAGLRAGVRAVADAPTVHHPLALMVVANVVYGALQVLMLVAAWQLLGMSEGGYGALCAGLGAGAFAALLVVGRAGKARRSTLALSGAVLLSSMPLALLAITSAPFVGVVLLAFSGLGLVVTEVLALAVLQQQLPGDRVSSVFGLLDSVTVGSMLIGSVIAGPLIGWLGIEWALVVVGALIPLVAVVAVPRLLQRRSPTMAVGVAVAGAGDLREVEVIAGGSSPVAAVRNFTINS
jgi:predicted MFS family arabinose efflux permease